MKLDQFEKEFDLNDNNNDDDDDYYLIPYGSRVYRTNEDLSDFDYIAIIKSSQKSFNGIEKTYNKTNIHIYDKENFQTKLKEHKIFALESYFHHDELIKDVFEFKLDLNLLRKEISSVSSNSFVKAKKKIEVESDYYIGWKSLFHSLRIILFGIQIAETGKIYDFSQANKYWLDIVHEKCYSWKPLQEKYKPIKNELLTKFRKIAPKIN